MDQLASLLVGLGIGYFAWKLAKIVFMIFTEARSELEFEERFREHLAQIIHVVKQEQEGDMYYWYDNDDDHFLAQGRTWEDIVGVLRDRFPDHIFVLNEREMIVGPEFKIVEFDIGAKR